MPRTAWTATICLLVLTGCGGAEVEPEATPSTTSGSSSTSTSSLAADDAAPQATPTEVVERWLAAIASGDADTTTSMLGPYSRAAVLDQGGVEEMMTGLGEGMAAFGADGVQRIAVELAQPDGAYVVTASGSIEREGMVERDARAWLVHPQGESDVVEAFSPVTPEIVSPATGSSTRAADETVRVYLPAGGVPGASVDGELVEEVTSEPADGDLSLVEATPPAGGWPSGEQTVTVWVVPTAGDGPWAAVAVPVTVD